VATDPKDSKIKEEKERYKKVKEKLDKARRECKEKYGAEYLKHF